MRTSIEPAMYVREKLIFWSQRSSYNHSINTTLTVHVVCSDDRIRRARAQNWFPDPFFGVFVRHFEFLYGLPLCTRSQTPVPGSRFPVPGSRFPVPRSRY